MLTMLAALAAPGAGAAPAGAPNAPLSAAAERDLQCMTLMLVGAGMEQDQTKLQGAIAGVYYYLARLDIEAPGLDLKQETGRVADALEGNPRAEEIGEACDTQFSAAAAKLAELGEEEAK